MSRDGSVGTVTIPDRTRILLFTTKSRSVLGPSILLSVGYQGLSSEVKQPSVPS